MHVVELAIAPSHATQLAKTFCESFRPAISRQPGHRSVDLLIGRDHKRAYLLIDFEDDASRMSWVESELHQQVWSQLAACCADYSSSDYDAVECEG